MSNDPQSCDSRAHIEDFSEAFDASWRKLTSWRFTIYRDVFSWFGPAMLEAGYLEDMSTPATDEVLRRAHAEWSVRGRQEPATDGRFEFDHT